MALTISQDQQAALAEAQLDVLADRVQAVLAPASPGGDVGQKVRNWLREGQNNGVTAELDLARLCLLLSEMDGQGKRPASVAERLADREVGGELKVFQVSNAWVEHLRTR